MPTPPLNRAGPDAGAERVAARMASVLREAEVLLVPIMGMRGVDALFKRSVHLASASHAWLAGADSADSLIALLAARTGDDASAGAAAYLHEFENLLFTLIGQALTGRLLPAGWADGATNSTT
jgi:hypothetical protein